MITREEFEQACAELDALDYSYKKESKRLENIMWQWFAQKDAENAKRLKEQPTWCFDNTTLTF